jgi:hypothetical protein
MKTSPVRLRFAGFVCVSLMWAGGAFPGGGTLARASQLRFATDAPIWFVEDHAPIEEPAARGLNRYHSFIDGYWLRPLDDLLGLHVARPAADINCVDEVPASSWFTPRRGSDSLAPQAVGRGPGIHPRLDAAGGLIVTGARVAGPEPYLVVRESTGRHCVLVIDDPAYPQMRTAATVIANRLLHACGYNVLESFIDEIDSGRLQVAEDAKEMGRYGAASDLRDRDLQALLDRVVPERGRLRVAVCRLPEGSPKGGFSDRGVRQDDPNDKIPHQDRRSLRGLRVICSWIDLARMRPDRTLDVYLEETGALRHYLFDLGMSLGASVQSPHPFGMEGEEPYWAMGTWLGNLFQLGFGEDYSARPAAPPFPGVGNFAAHGFDPLAWQPAYRYEPFVRMDWSDACWGARIVSQFEDEQIGAAVAAGKLSDARAAGYLRGALIERRDRLAAGWFDHINAAADFSIASPNEGRWLLSCHDLGVAARVRLPEDIQYVMVFSLPDLGAELGQQARGGHYLDFDLSPFVPPRHLHRDDPRRYGVAALRAYSHTGRLQVGTVNVHIYFDPQAGPRVIGIERG